MLYNHIANLLFFSHLTLCKLLNVLEITTGQKSERLALENNDS